MSWSSASVRRGAALTILFALSGAGCASGEDETSEGASAPGSSERRGIGLELPSVKKSATSEAGFGERAQALSSPVPFPLDDRRSLFVSDSSIVSQVKLGDVLAKLAGSSAGALPLYKAFWRQQGAVPPCDPNLNGFPNFCESLEAAQANDADPFDAAGKGLENPEAYHAVALVNRVDLTSSSGADCGEFRIIFGKNPQVGPRSFSRSLVIFEAVLPNPKPTLGLVGCRPAQMAWARLSDPALTDAQRASSLKAFFLDGVDGVPPVVRAANYAGGASGRIRTNQFFQDAVLDQGALRPWLLREFVLSGSGTVTPSQVTTKENPFVGLFDSTRADGIANQFVDYLSRQDVVRALAVNDLNRFGYGGAFPNRFNAGVSQSSPFGLPNMNTPNDYTTTFAAGGAAHRLRARLQNTLNSIGSTLTPEHIVARAQSLSCAGCHLLSSEEERRSLGLTNPDGSEHLFPPVSTPFTHIDERSTDANGRFIISAAVEEFIQFRHQVQQSYFDRTASFPLSATIQVTDNWATGYCADIVLRNTSSSAFSVWQVNLTVSGASLQGPGWGGTFVTAQNKWEITPPTFGAPIGPGSVYKPRFCANKSVSGAAPQVTVTASLGYRP